MSIHFGKFAEAAPTADAAEGVARADARAVNSASARALYKARAAIHPKLVFGPFRTAKWAFLAFALAIYYGLPWVRWPRAGGAPDQAVLVDFPGRRFYFFFIEIWPQEVYYLTGLLILAALALFLVTALFGRVWCGYACPQTVWTDLFIAVERLVEGDRNARLRLAKERWSFGKIRKKIVKHVLWLVIAAATGGAWVLYFHDAPLLARDFFAGNAPATAYLFAGLLTFTTYTLAGTMREQVCTYMCPWPRIQGAMTDEETIEVTYRHDRGEPRGPHKKGESWEGRGDCIDCRQCVAACPMGIDIRDGDQLECIGCALCIDACDGIMAKVGQPKGLIAYDSADNLARRERGEAPRWRPVRPRTVFYAVALACVSGLMLFGLATRVSLELSVLRDRNPHFVRLSDGSVRNGYTLKVTNKADRTRVIHVDVEGPAGLRTSLLGQGDAMTLRVAPDKVASFRLFLVLPRAALVTSSVPIRIVLTDEASSERVETRDTFQTGIGR